MRFLVLSMYVRKYARACHGVFSVQIFHIFTSQVLFPYADKPLGSGGMSTQHLTLLLTVAWEQATLRALTLTELLALRDAAPWEGYSACNHANLFENSPL
jgi:hypothetical protein